MPYRHSYIPNFDSGDHSIPCSGMLRLRKGDDLEDGSHIYTSGVWTKSATDKTSVKVIVQEPGDDAAKLAEAAVVNLSSGFLAFNKAGRPFAVYTLADNVKPIIQPKPPAKAKGPADDHKDLGHLWCNFVGVIQRLDGVKNKVEEASATWTVEVPIDGGSFKAIVEYGPRPVGEIELAVKSFVLGDVAHFHARWNGMDAKNPKTPTFLLGSMTVVNVVNIVALATPAGDAASSTSKQSKAKNTAKPTPIKKEKEAKPKRKGRDSDEEEEDAGDAEPEASGSAKGNVGGKKALVKSPVPAAVGRRGSRSVTAAPRAPVNEPAVKKPRVESP